MKVKAEGEGCDGTLKVRLGEPTSLGAMKQIALVNEFDPWPE